MGKQKHTPDKRSSTDDSVNLGYSQEWNSDLLCPQLLLHSLGWTARMTYNFIFLFQVKYIHNILVMFQKKKFKISRKLDEAYSISKNLILNFPKFWVISHTFAHCLSAYIYLHQITTNMHAGRKGKAIIHQTQESENSDLNTLFLICYSQDLHIASKSYLLNS